MTSLEALEQIAKSKGVNPFTNQIQDNAVLFPIGFKTILNDLERLEKLEKTIKILRYAIELPLEDDIAVFNRNINYYVLRAKALIDDDEYELLKEILDNE